MTVSRSLPSDWPKRSQLSERSLEESDEYRWLARIYDPITGPFLNAIRRYVAEMIRKAGYGKVLDLCCGTGRQCILLHSMGVCAVGVDLSRAMLSVAKEKSPSFIPYIRQDVANLGFRDNCFEAIIICLALHEKPSGKREAILEQAVRVLAPGGRLYLLDFASPAGPAGRAMRLGIAGVERLAGRDHYANYRSYIRAGGMSGVTAGFPLKREKGGIYFWRGNMELVVLSPQK